MIRASVAEWMLSIAMSPERAASTVGDLLESVRSPLIFWSAVLRTFTSAALHQISIGAVGKTVFLIAVTWLPLEMMFVETINRIQPHGIQTFIALRLAMYLLMGRIVAGRMPQREMVVWITYALGQVPAVIASMNAPPSSSSHILYASPNFFELLNVFLGCLLARRRSLRKATP